MGKVERSRHPENADLMGRLAEQNKPNLWVLFDEALASARRDVESDNPHARTAARKFLKRAAASKATQALQALQAAQAARYPEGDDCAADPAAEADTANP